jgi:CheY-like chemotaxis protein
MIPPDNKKKVLIVESNDATATAFQHKLQDAGFDARTTWSGHEALALLQSNEFDVLLMDNYLPDLHATDFLERLGRLPLQPWVVVMKGGSASRVGGCERSEQAGRRAGCASGVGMLCRGAVGEGQRALAVGFLHSEKSAPSATREGGIFPWPIVKQ